MKRPHAFEAASGSTLERCMAISHGRGAAYGDTWSMHVASPVLEELLRRLNVETTAEERRLIRIAALIDVKDQRLLGGWKLDHLEDGINYRAAYASWREEYELEEAQ